MAVSEGYGGPRWNSCGTPQFNINNSININKNFSVLEIGFNQITEAVGRRSSGKKGVLKNFAKFTGKSPCQSLFFN